MVPKVGKRTSGAAEGNLRNHTHQAGLVAVRATWETDKRTH
jgi:hypothetical protein